MLLIELKGNYTEFENVRQLYVYCTGDLLNRNSPSRKTGFHVMFLCWTFGTLGEVIASYDCSANNLQPQNVNLVIVLQWTLSSARQHAALLCWSRHNLHVDS